MSHISDYTVLKEDESECPLISQILLWTHFRSLIIHVINIDTAKHMYEGWYNYNQIILIYFVSHFTKQYELNIKTDGGECVFHSLTSNMRGVALFFLFKSQR